MKFGLWYDLRNPVGSGRRLPDLYRDTLDQIVWAEQLGYDDIWLSEHHFIDDGYLPSLLPFAAAVAARTSHVTIGTSIVLMPFHHPIRLAEDCAVVDNLSDGRFLLGVAVGYRREEFAAFGVERKHRGAITEEAVEIMIKCWTEEEFSYHGRHFHFDHIRCTPKPVQQPRIPVWFGAVQGEAIRRAARLGDGLLAGGRGRYEAYVAALREAGKPYEHPHIAGGHPLLFCSEEPQRDWDRLKPHALYQLRHYATWFKEAGQPVFGEPPQDYADLERRQLYLVGTPEELIASIRQQYATAPFERYFFWAIWPGVDVATANRSVRLFAEKVIPELRSLGETTGHS
jgi:probable F420-dependent oxidoreductase